MSLKSTWKEANFEYLGVCWKKKKQFFYLNQFHTSRMTYPSPSIMSFSSSFPIRTDSRDLIWPREAKRLMVSWTEAALMVYVFLMARRSSPTLSYCLLSRLNILRTSSGSWMWHSWDQLTMVWEISSFRLAGNKHEQRRLSFLLLNKLIASY